MPSKQKKVIKAWAILSKEGKLRKDMLYEGCPNCDNSTGGYTVLSSKESARFFASNYLKDEVVPCEIHLLTPKKK